MVWSFFYIVFVFCCLSNLYCLFCFSSCLDITTMNCILRFLFSFSPFIYLWNILNFLWLCDSDLNTAIRIHFSKELGFITGDYWRLVFRNQHLKVGELILLKRIKSMRVSWTTAVFMTVCNEVYGQVCSFALLTSSGLHCHRKKQLHALLYTLRSSNRIWYFTISYNFISYIFYD